MDFAKFSETHFSNWGWRHVRIAILLTLLSIILVDFAITRSYHYLDLARSQRLADIDGRVIRRWLHRDDPRGFLDLPVRKSTKAVFGLGWISGSSISIQPAPPQWKFRGREAYAMTDVAAEYIRSVNGQPVAIHEYLMQGARTGDIRRAILHAASAPEIDAILVPINPVWILNEWLMFTASRQRGALISQQNLLLSDYLMALQTVGPFDITVQLLRPVSGLFNYRFAANRNLPLKNHLSFLIRKKSGTVGASQYSYWRRWFYPKTIEDSPPKSFDGKLRGYRDAIFMQNVDINGSAARIFRSNVRTLKRSGKPTILYVPALPEILQQDTTLMQRLDALFVLLKNIVTEENASNVWFTSSPAFGTRQPYEHRDIIHLKHGQGAIDTILDLLEQKAGLKLVRNDARKLYGVKQ